MVFGGLKKMNIDHCLGVVSYCKSDEMPERFERLKESITSMRSLKNDNNFMFLWDNGSSKDVREFLKSCDFFDNIFFSSQNLYDAGPICLLNILAQKLGAKYVTFMEDDNLVFDADAIPCCFEFLKNNPDCGYVRLLKWESTNMKIYDKFADHPQKDISHMCSHFNCVATGEERHLKWEEPQKYYNVINPKKEYTIHKNNWHWTEFPSICRAEVFDKIVPSDNFGVLQGLEKFMMDEYHKLSLKTGALDGGAILHNQPGFGPKVSLRVKDEKLFTNLIISSDIILGEIEKVCKQVFEEDL